jgi:hypothetical protein
MILSLIITWILVIARLVIAVQLTLVARRQKLPNLLWLAAFFYITGIGDIFFTLLSATNLPWLLGPFKLSVGLGEVVLVMFIQKTFYQDRKSPYLIFMLIALGFLLANIFLGFFVYWSPFNWLWLIVVGYQAYKRIAANPSVEDWAKVRYKLVIAYSLAMLFPPIYTILWVVSMVVPALSALISSPIGQMAALLVNVGFSIIGVVLAYLAWVMPKGYRNWLNRNYQPPVTEQVEAELSEEEIMRKLKARS